MTTSPAESPAESTAAPVATERIPLRISLDKGSRSGSVDGAWWPQSRDLEVEATDLVDHFPQIVGSVERLLFSRPDWDSVTGAPSMRRIEGHRGPIKVGSFPSDDTHVMIAKMGSGQRLRLLVVPSDTEPVAAARVMAQAADSDNTQPPGELLGLAVHDQSGIGFNAWKDETSVAH